MSDIPYVNVVESEMGLRSTVKKMSQTLGAAEADVEQSHARGLG